MTSDAKPGVGKIEISNDFIKRENTLNSEISHVQNLIDDLIGHKLAIENANSIIQQMIKVEKDLEKKSKLNFYVMKNIELLTKVFTSISELENIKYRYHKEVDDVLLNKFKLIAVEIRKIDEKISSPEDGIFAFFDKIKEATTPNKIGEINQTIKDNKEYRL